MALHVIPCSAVSSAVTLVSPTMPCFAATYADLNADATKPCAEAMLMMRPHLLRSIDGKANRVVWKADDRLMAKIASHFSGGKCCNEATCWIPALLTRMSSRPNICSVCSIISRIAAGFDISAGENDTRTLKSEAILACTSAISSGLPKPLRTISEPAAAKALAIAKANSTRGSRNQRHFTRKSLSGRDVFRFDGNVHGARSCSDGCRSSPSHQFAGGKPSTANAYWLMI